MISKLKRLLRGEGGITGLETAIILIAFVVVAAVFAFTVLSAGVFSSEKGKEAVYAGLGEVRGSMEIKGSVIAVSDLASSTENVDEVFFTVANVAGGEAIDVQAPTTVVTSTGLTASTNHKVVINYRDKYVHKPNVGWYLSWIVRNDLDHMLEEGELAKITVPLTATGTTHPTANDTFILEIKPPQGGVLVIERTIPAYVDKRMDLH